MSNDLLISDLEISIRAYQVLKQNNIISLKQLCNYNKNDLIKYKNFGKRSILEVEQLMRENNLKFKNE